MSLSPTKEWVLALLLLALLPLALPWVLVCFGGLAVILFTWEFFFFFFMRWSSTHGGLASGFSGSQASRFGLLVYVQGTSDSLPRSSPVVRSNLVSGIAVRVLLLASSLPLGMDFSLAPGRCLSVGARWSSSGHPTYVFFFSECTLRPGLGLDLD